MSAVTSPLPVGRTGQGSNEHRHAASGTEVTGARSGAPVVRVAHTPLAAEEARMIRLGELARISQRATQIGAAAAALQLAERAVGEMPRMVERLKATADLATRVDNDEGRAEVNAAFVELRDAVLGAGADATFRGSPLFATVDGPGQVPVGAMQEVRARLDGLEVTEVERLPEVVGMVDTAVHAAERERESLRNARNEVDGAAASLGHAVSADHDLRNMEARARAVAQAMRAAPASAAGALRNPAAVAMALGAADRT